MMLPPLIATGAFVLTFQILIPSLGIMVTAEPSTVLLVNIDVPMLLPNDIMRIPRHVLPDICSSVLFTPVIVLFSMTHGEKLCRLYMIPLERAVI